MIKHPEQRVAIFIDTQNMYYSARNLFGARVNFKNIVEDAVSGRKLTRAIAYVVATKTGEERPFFEALKGAGIETKEKELQIYGGMKKADWDVGIAVDAIKLADKVDAIVIASGDGDFYPGRNKLAPGIVESGGKIAPQIEHNHKNNNHAGQEDWQAGQRPERDPPKFG